MICSRKETQSKSLCVSHEEWLVMYTWRARQFFVIYLKLQTPSNSMVFFDLEGISFRYEHSRTYPESYIFDVHERKYDKSRYCTNDSNAWHENGGRAP